MKFKDLSVFLEKLEKTSSRIEITKILADLFKKSSPEEIDKIVYLLLGQLAPNYQGIVFNLADRLMIQVLSEAYKIDSKEISKLYKQKGDLGIVAASLAKEKGKNPSVLEIYKCLLEIAGEEGKGSQERKITKMATVLTDLDPLSCRFVTRIPVGRLRLGFSDKTILDALSWMEFGDKRAKESLEKAYVVISDSGLLAKLVKEKGIKKASSSVSPQVGIPVQPMLAQRLKSPDEMIKKMGKVSIEPKFDGVRILIHLKKSGKKHFLRAFTRNLNDVSQMFPELRNISSQISAHEVILDTEAVGIDPRLAQMVNFQETMRRRRKYDLEEFASKIPLRFQVFDILLKDGKNLMTESYIKRREILSRTIRKGKFLVVDENLITTNPNDIRGQHAKWISKGLEGVIVKKAESSYIPGRTGWRWVKMKEAETSKASLADTVDCIVMGYTGGKGKRVGFGVGQFLAGIVDESGGRRIKTITKVGTGLKDEQFRELKKRLSKLEVQEMPKEYEVNKILVPDYWVEPDLVVELAADEITVSPTHSSGFALRFPRLVRFRDDKGPNEATTRAEIKKLFKLQKT